MNNVIWEKENIKVLKNMLGKKLQKWSLYYCYYPILVIILYLVTDWIHKLIFYYNFGKVYIIGQISTGYAYQALEIYKWCQHGIKRQSFEINYKMVPTLLSMSNFGPRT